MGVVKSLSDNRIAAKRNPEARKSQNADTDNAESWQLRSATLDLASWMQIAISEFV
jgi:hypothetical protein